MRYLLILISLLSISVYAQPSKPQPQRSEPWIRDQDDQTDTLAIPLDSSEEEERQEQEKLQKKNPRSKQSY